MGCYFSDFPFLLQWYQTYLGNQEELLIQLDLEMKRHREFDRLIVEFESRKICYLPLTSFLMKPMQKLLHYKLILESENFYNPVAFVSPQISNSCRTGTDEMHVRSLMIKLEGTCLGPDTGTFHAHNLSSAHSWVEVFWKKRCQHSVPYMVWWQQILQIDGFRDVLLILCRCGYFVSDESDRSWQKFCIFMSYPRALIIRFSPISHHVP